MNQSFQVLKDLYALSSIFYIKGIVDANTVCDPYLIDEVYQRDDDYTTFELIIDDNKWSMEAEDYILNITQEASFHNLHFIRNYILHICDDNMRKAICHLMDFLYRQGLRRYAIYNGGQPEKLLKDATPNSTKFLTPKGDMTQAAWHDQIRQYIMQIKLTHIKAGQPPIMQKLNEYMAVVLKNKTEFNEIKHLENERRLYIISGGNIPTQRNEDI